MGRGGVRPNAGRRIKGDLTIPRRTVSFSLHPKFVEALDGFTKTQGYPSRSDALENLLKEKFFPGENGELAQDPPIAEIQNRILNRRIEGAKKQLKQILGEPGHDDELRSLARDVLLKLEGKR